MRTINDMPRIRERRGLDPMDVRDYCIEHQYYTAGDNDDYSDMLQFVKKSNCSKEDLWRIAVDILEHTPGRFSVADYEDVMYGLSAMARSFYTIC